MSQLGELTYRVKNGDGVSFEIFNGRERICRDFWKNIWMNSGIK